MDFILPESEGLRIEYKGDRHLRVEKAWGNAAKYDQL